MARKVHYFSDEIIGTPEKSSWRKNRYDSGGAADLFTHDDGLFDQDESGSGELFDQATGERINNSTHTGIENLVEVKPVDALDGSHDVMGSVPEEGEYDIAAAWLAAHEVQVEEVHEIGLISAA